MSTYIPGKESELGALDEVLGVVHASADPIGGPDLGAAFTKMIVSLAIIVLLLLVSYRFIRRLIRTRLQKGAGDSAIQILEKRMLSPKTMLYLVEVDRKKVLIAESQLEIKRLDSFPANSEGTQS